MNDLKSLDDAFAELERRADSYAPRPEPRRSRVPRLAPVAAAVVVAAGLVTGIAVLPHDGGSPSPTTVSVATKPSGTHLPVREFTVPATPDDLINRFRTVLGGTAAFTVTNSAPAAVDGNGDVVPGSGTAIFGVLTTGSGSGGFDLQIAKSPPGTAGAHCDDLDRAHCEIRTLPDGSSLAVGSETLRNNEKGRTHQVDLVREDGTEILMHVSNERDPKGESDLLSPEPPLTTDQMIAIVTSAQW